MTARDVTDKQVNRDARTHEMLSLLCDLQITPMRAFEIAHTLNLHLMSGVLPREVSVTIETPAQCGELAVRLVVHAKLLHPRTNECVTFRVPGTFDFLDPRRAIQRMGSDIVKKIQTVR